MSKATKQIQESRVAAAIRATLKADRGQAPAATKAPSKEAASNDTTSKVPKLREPAPKGT